MVTDKIGNYINSLKNLSAVNKTELRVPYTKLLHEIAKVLQLSGYVSEVNKTGKGTEQILITSIAKPIKRAYRISRPSKRVYTKSGNAPMGKGNQGITVLSTPEGIMTGANAKQKNIGGEVLFTII